MISRLIYKSTALCSDGEARTLCGHAKSSNDAADITGALYLSNGVFLQYLEGNEFALSALYARIQRDVRHTGCTVLDSKQVSTRMFKGWGMAWLPESHSSQLLLEAIVPRSPTLIDVDGNAAGTIFMALAQTSPRH